MIETIYVEENIRQHPRVEAILSRFSHARQIICERYSEVFNPKTQNFRLQKQNPALILAEKHKNFVLEAPVGYGIGAKKNYYFSHMLNCLYDCRYCFLQGMYASANYVLFVNYEDFQTEIQSLCQSFPSENIHFFSGYDCDSLALEPISGFAGAFMSFFETIPNGWLELRTKSTQIRTLLEREPLSRCVVAFSLSPDEIVKKVEAKTPSLARRLASIEKLQQQGWNIGLRFDPLIYQSDYKQQYQQFFDTVFTIVRLENLHSVSLGGFRLPDNYFKKMQKLYPDETIFASPLESRNGMISYRQSLESELMNYTTEQVLTHIPASKFFPCTF
ncbi:MAG: DNA photolyase [Methylococcaceae bacterium]|nr:DNA photolyase [Methylococcaceae bacterium]